VPKEKEKQKPTRTPNPNLLDSDCWQHLRAGCVQHEDSHTSVMTRPHKVCRSLSSKTL
ncbi:hypothetical protein STEG23_005316, partial [Scotinomys teguina]